MPAMAVGQPTDVEAGTPLSQASQLPQLIFVGGLFEFGQALLYEAFFWGLLGQ
ncbi:hypothetical protein K2E96_10540 [Pseudomonas sp. ERGC3:05]|nr:hypothetical protein [Pseudomonas sp. ERGC3:01]QZC96392.1 hypothetical protein K2E96_10540 [Pseudomonas sp. ERGC3:05]